jgi:hypothetical protein
MIMIETTRVSLQGGWQLRFEGEATWREIAVPGCWETADGPKDRAGPAWYRRSLTLPALHDGARVWLEFDAVSYDCSVIVNGVQCGAHTGLWDAFRVEISEAVRDCAEAEVLVRVEKPAGLTAGPDSASVDGRFPLRSTLAGFLPYVWGQIFGGIWQDVRLAVTGASVLTDVRVRGTQHGQVSVDVTCSDEQAVTLELLGAGGERLLAQEARAARHDAGGARASFSAQIADPRPWSPHDPNLYTARVRVAGDTREVRFGLRTLETRGTDILLNGRPIYPRMLLSWGWYADLLHCNPGPERVRDELMAIKALGYNGVKLCLWFPPAYYFEIADQLGMLLWVELPMWLPRPDAHFRAQLAPEYEALVRQSCDHPAVILYSLGCELNRAIGPEILEPLYRMVKRLAGDALVRDNSGSGEAYGGLLHEYADYYDYHFYSDIHFFRALIDYFTPRWRPVQPWVFGEFCDLDTFRDVRRLAEDRPSPPWWISSDPAINPQGARWQFDVPFFLERARERGLWERGAELERISYRHALLHRKWTIEAVRCYREIGGYVITGEVDTPISTAGMWNDFGELKFEPGEMRAFNGDTILALGWDKRRDWVHGGDRAAYWDTRSYEGGARVRAHLILSHYGREQGQATLRWDVTLPGAGQVAAGSAESAQTVLPGSVGELALAEFELPQVVTPRQLTLTAQLRIGECEVHNQWPLWLFPSGSWSDLRAELYDPRGILSGLQASAPGLVVNGGAPPGAGRPAMPLIATAWSPAVADFVEQGGRAILLQDGAGFPGPLATAAMPFWREAVRVAEEHPAWGDFPHDGWAGLQFFGCASDHALITGVWAGQVRPILRRIDVRTLDIHDYAAEITIGAGRAIVSTLRFEGGHGEQPAGIARNTAARYLLGCWVRYLSGV